MWHWKQILRYILLWVLLCFALGIIAALFEIEASTVQVSIIVCCVIYLLVTISYNFLFMQPYRRRVQQQNAEMEAGNLEIALENINAMPEKLKEQVCLVHHLNTCICLFYSGTEEKALAYYHTHEKLFHTHRGDRNYKGNLALLKCWVLSAQGELATARELCKQTKALCNTPSLLEAYDKLEQHLAGHSIKTQA